VFENLALRQQSPIYHRTRPKPTLRGPDRLFWVGLRLAWPELEVGLADRTTRHGHFLASPRLRVVLDRRSRPRGGRPQVSADVRRLTREMVRGDN
jgi:hypothetical protein